MALLVLTAAATAFGLSDLISASAGGYISPGELLIVMALAACAVTVMWLALEFAIEGRGLKRAICVAVYLLFAIWSVGFGFGFYWKHLASVHQAQTELQNLGTEGVEPLKTTLQSLNTVKGQIADISTYAGKQQSLEDTEGGSCEGVASGTGRGDLWSARDGLTKRTDALTADLTRWIDGPAPTPTQDLQEVLGQIEVLSEDVRKTRGDAFEELKARFDTVGGDAETAVGRVNGIIRQRESYIKRLEEISKQARDGIPTPAGVCRDSGLADTLDSAATALRALKEIPKPDFQPKIGAEATKDAFYRLVGNLGALVTAILPFVPDIELTKRERLNALDFQAVAAAIVVDIGIAFLTLWGRDPNRLQRIDRLFLARPRNRRLYGELARFSQSDPALLRSLFDGSVIRYDRDDYLIASEEIPEFNASMRNLQTVLMTAGEARDVTPSEREFPAWLPLPPAIRTVTNHAVRRKLAEIVTSLSPAGPAWRRRPRTFDAFDLRRVRVVRISRDLTFYLQQLFSLDPEALAAEAAAAPPPRDPPPAADPPPRPRGPAPPRDGPPEGPAGPASTPTEMALNEGDAIARWQSAGRRNRRAAEPPTAEEGAPNRTGRRSAAPLSPRPARRRPAPPDAEPEG